MSVKSTQSSFRDRTQEFESIAGRLKKSLTSGSGLNGPTSSSRSDELRSNVAIQSEFNRRASKIGYGIHQTSQKLAKLAKLAKRTSVFDDPTMEIQELTAIIKQDITALNSAVVDLRLLSNSRHENGIISSDTTSHSTTVVDDLKNRLMSATKEFKEVLTMRTENLKVHENRRQLFSSTASKDSANPFVRQRPLASRMAASASNAIAPPWASGPSSSAQMAFDHRKQEDRDRQPLLQQQHQLVPLQDSYMQSRAEALQNVESTIHELGNIFNQLATLVSQQGEIAVSTTTTVLSSPQCVPSEGNLTSRKVNMEENPVVIKNCHSLTPRNCLNMLRLRTRLDENMDDTLANVEGAQGALLKYLNSISSNRWLMIKIFFILIFFLMVFLFFVA